MMKIGIKKIIKTKNYEENDVFRVMRRNDLDARFVL